MAHARTVQLSEQQRAELLDIREHHPKPHLRLKAAAVLKVADGQSARQVGLHGLNRPVHPDRVNGWISTYLQQGQAGWQVKRGRGRKPVFSPVHETDASAKAALMELLVRSPRLAGWPYSRWSLARIRQAVSWLRESGQQQPPISLGGLSKLLHRLGISYKRGRRHVHSPDLLYNQKLRVIEAAQRLNQRDPRQYVFLYEDEMTYYKRPRVGRVYAPQGHETLPAEQGLGFNSLRRIAGCLDIQSGAIIARQRGTYPVKEFARFLLFVERHYPDAKLIYIALDNWPVHFHPFVRDELLAHHSRIRLLSLPTYAPWTNPIEKVWLELDQDILDQHELANDWETLKQKVVDWFVPLQHGSVQMLRTVGLCPD